jgi:hypothetical protein
MLVNFALASARWTEQQANAWYQQQPWLMGSNFIPASAINTEVGRCFGIVVDKRPSD